MQSPGRGGADRSYSTCIYANEMQALFSAFASNKQKRTHIGSGNVSVSVLVYLGLKSIVDTLSITVLRISGDNSIDT